jgi:hypothetical protein
MRIAAFSRLFSDTSAVSSRKKQRLAQRLGISLVAHGATNIFLNQPEKRPSLSFRNG